MRKFGVLLAVGGLLATSCWPAVAAPVDDYVFWKTAGLIDDQCHYLKAVERNVLSRVTGEALQSLPQSEHYAEDRMSAEDYDAWLTRTDDAAVTQATDVGCTAAAEPFLLQARGAASESIFQDLVLAFHFNALPKDDIGYVPLAADQIQAATGYDQFLKKVYGANYQAFVTAQRDLASRRLPQQDLFGQTYDPLGIGLPDAGPDYTEMWGLQSQVMRTVEAIQFEVSAEVAGYRVWPERFGGNEVLALHPNGSTEPVGHIISGPKTLKVEGGTEIHGVVVRMLNGQLWMMSYGAEAQAPAVAQAAVALLVRSDPLEEGQSSYQAWAQDNWRERTNRHDMARVEIDMPKGAMLVYARCREERVALAPGLRGRRDLDFDRYRRCTDANKQVAGSQQYCRAAAVYR